MCGYKTHDVEVACMLHPRRVLRSTCAVGLRCVRRPGDFSGCLGLKGSRAFTRVSVCTRLTPLASFIFGRKCTTYIAFKGFVFECRPGTAFGAVSEPIFDREQGLFSYGRIFSLLAAGTPAKLNFFSFHGDLLAQNYSVVELLSTKIP